MARQVTWRRSERDGDVAWSAKTFGYTAKFDYKLKVYAGIESSFYNRNARLEISKSIPGTRKKEVLLTREFISSWHAKEAIDAVITLCYIFYKENPKIAEEWFIKTLSDYNGASMPSQPEELVLSYGGKSYKYYR